MMCRVNGAHSEHLRLHHIQKCTGANETTRAEKGTHSKVVLAGTSPVILRVFVVKIMQDLTLNRLF